MSDKKGRKDVLVFLLKLTVSFALLAYIILKKASVPDILRVLRGVDIFWILASFSLHALGVWISAVRWRILILAQGDTVPLGYLVKSYLVGTFFNNFLPSRFGGDVVRIWDGSRYSGSVLRSSAVVLVERLTGVIILLLLVGQGAELAQLGDAIDEFGYLLAELLFCEVVRVHQQCQQKCPDDVQ